MNETELVNALDSDGLGLGIVFQVSGSDGALVIVINRPEPAPLDYHLFKVRIIKILEKFDLAGISILYLYSRILGVEECDWQDQVAIANSPKVSPPQDQDSEHKTELLKANTQTQEAIASPEEPIKTVSKEINQYTFGISEYLINTVAEPPETEIAGLVYFFDQLKMEEKQRVLPALEQFFQTQNQDVFQGLPPELSDWLQKIAGLSSRKRKSTSIWLARYCVRGEEILETVTKNLTVEEVPMAELKSKSSVGSVATDAQLSPETLADSVNPSVKSDRRVPSAKPQSGSVLDRKPVATAQNSAKVSSITKSNILPMAVALLVLGLVGGLLTKWLLSIFGPIPVSLGLIAGLLSGIGIAYGNAAAKSSTVGTVVALIFFREFFFSSLVGTGIGLATGMAIKSGSKAPKSENKSLDQRGAIGLSSVLIGMVLGTFLLGGGIGKDSTISSSSGSGSSNTDNSTISSSSESGSSSTDISGDLTIFIEQKSIYISMVEARSMALRGLQEGSIFKMPLKRDVIVKIENADDTDCQLTTIPITIIRNARGQFEDIKPFEPSEVPVTPFAMAPAKSKTEASIRFIPGAYFLHCGENTAGTILEDGGRSIFFEVSPEAS